MKLELSKYFAKKLAGKIEQYNFDVGVLHDKSHYKPDDKKELGSYAGGQVRKKSRVKSELTTAEILVENMKRLNINLLQAPFKDANNADIVKFMQAFLKSAVAGRSMKRVENLLQAVVRNPILRLDYDRNKSSTADAKGFDRHLFDTGQMFQAIKVKVNTRGKK